MSRYSGILKTLGPGILFAGAAIGVSHLVQSTRAGASYGFSLLFLVLVTNLLKYPFFEYGHRYTAATGESLLEGYRKLGRWAIVTFLCLSLVTSFINVSAITLVTAGLAEYLFQTGLNPVAISTVLLTLIVILLILGKYPLLDKLMKFMIVILSITTIVALVAAVRHGAAVQEGFVSPQIWTFSGIAFMLALMGWMPAPIEVSVWQSLWALERKKQTRHHPTMKEALTDFYVGYGGAAVLALVFLSLGALVMYGTGEEFANSGVAFSAQLVQLYTKTLGEWSHVFISAAALITMFSTLITVLDAYPRVLRGSMILSFDGFRRWQNALYWIWVVILAVISIIVILFFQHTLRSLIDLATIIAFLSAPGFAIINYIVITSPQIPEELRPPRWLKLISWVGMIYLVGFGLIYIGSRFWAA